MRVEISEQLALFLASFACGCLLSAFYDLIRISRMSAGVVYGGLRIPERSALCLPLIREGRPKKRSKLRLLSLDALVFIGDVLFFAVAALALLCVFYNYGGKVRGAGVFMAACGFLAAHFTVGAVVIRLFAVLRLCIVILFEYLAFFLMLPVRKLVLPLWRLTVGAITRRLRLAYLRVYTKKCERSILSALGGLKEK